MALRFKTGLNNTETITPNTVLQTVTVVLPGNDIVANIPVTNNSTVGEAVKQAFKARGMNESLINEQFWVSTDHHNVDKKDDGCRYKSRKNLRILPDGGALISTITVDDTNLEGNVTHSCVNEIEECFNTISCNNAGLLNTLLNSSMSSSQQEEMMMPKASSMHFKYLTPSQRRYLLAAHSTPQHPQMGQQRKSFLWTQNALSV